jgi:phage antirepressor YoqD-like protein
MNTHALIAPIAQTMSSIEIAQLTDKQHIHVLRDIRDQLYTGLYGHKFDNPKLDYPIIQGLTVIIDDHTKRTKEILLDKYHTDILVSGYEVKYRAAIVKRWHELEEQAEKPTLNPANLSRLQLIQLALEAELELQAEKAITAELKPKAQALDRLSESEGSQCITDSAKVLKVQPKKLFAFLQAQRWIYKRAGGKNWLGYQDKIQSGLLEHKIATIEKPDGTERTVEQVLLTPKGIAKLARVTLLTNSLANKHEY